jgi:hypothetical protein
MPLGPFALISLFYLALGARVVFQLARSFRQTFDLNFTRQDRMLVDQAAFFVLVPISVALHELGHAVAIWLFGGDVLDWGFYGFAGYVAYDPRQFSTAQQILIASAGTLVNLALAALAIGLVFLKRPPFRAAINELLIQFTWISLLNALIVYPLLDLISGLNGDWAQMYDVFLQALGGNRAQFNDPTLLMLSLAILIVHVTVLGVIFWAWKSPRARSRIAAMTGGPIAPQRSAAPAGEPTAAERTRREAASRVASGWPTPIEAAIQRGRGGSALVLTWGDGGLRRSVIAATPDTGGLELSGALRVTGQPPEQRALGRDPNTPDVERLTLVLRLAIETVEGWTPSPDDASPAAPTRASTPAD